MRATINDDYKLQFNTIHPNFIFSVWFHCFHFGSYPIRFYSGLPFYEVLYTDTHLFLSMSILINFPDDPIYDAMYLNLAGGHSNLRLWVITVWNKWQQEMKISINALLQTLQGFVIQIKIGINTLIPEGLISGLTLFALLLNTVHVSEILWCLIHGSDLMIGLCLVYVIHCRPTSKR